MQLNTIIFGKPKASNVLSPRINDAIPFQKFELIRDRIAEILKIELENQIALQTDQKVKDLLESSKIYAERWSPYNQAEMLAISVFLFSSVYDNKHPQHARAKNTFFIDMYGEQSETSTERAEETNAKNLHRVAGIIRAILENPNWIRLGFDPDQGNTFIHGHEVKSVQRTEEENNRDSTVTMFYRMIFEVTASEDTKGIDGIPLGLSTTVVKLCETDIGYEYIFDPNP